MNFCAFIGIIERVIEKHDDVIKLLIKVEKDEAVAEKEAWFDLIPIDIKKPELILTCENCKAGDMVGIKGRFYLDKINAERVQVF